MKKLLLCAVLAAATFQSNAQVLQKGDNSVNLYYGVNVIGTFYKNLASDAGVDVVIKNIGPVGLVYEHMITEKIGFGGELGYSSTDVTWKEYVDPFATGGATYDYNYHITTLRVQARMNLHFVNTDHFDMYALFNGGYRGTTIAFKSTDPLAEEAKVSGLVPIGIKVGLGFRYFFTPGFGLNMELALGSPMLCGGLAFKF